MDGYRVLVIVVQSAGRRDVIVFSACSSVGFVELRNGIDTDIKTLPPVAGSGMDGT